MKKYKGSSIVPGDAVGTIFLYTNEKPYIKKQNTENVQEEVLRFQQAKQQATRQLNQLYGKILEEIDEETAAIFEVQAMMLEDEDYNETVLEVILTQQKRAEYAVAMAGDLFSSFFINMEDEYFKAKSVDIRDITERLERILTEQEGNPGPLEEPMILAAEDLSPSDLIQMDREKILGLITTYCSVNSHTAIIAKTLEIPMLTGIELQKDWNGKQAVLDGEEGFLYTEPEEEILEEVRARAESWRELFRTVKGKETITADGRQMTLYSWMETWSDLVRIKRYDGEGMILLSNIFFPYTEENLFQSYQSILCRRKEQKIIIGTDGACTEKSRVKMQMRAVLRASNYGKVSILFTRISSIGRLLELKELLQDAKDELEGEKIPFCDIAVGVLIATAGEGMMSDFLAAEVDFIAVALKELTENMLAQKLEAVDFPEYAEGFYPSVYRLLDLICCNAKQRKCDFIVNGNIKEEGELLKELVELRTDGLCVSPVQVLPLRKKIGSLEAK